MTRREEMITQSEVASIFGETMPIEAAMLLMQPGDRSVEQLRTELRRLSQAEPGYVVKPLEWNEYEREGDIDEWDAETSFGTFYGVKRRAFCFTPYYDCTDFPKECQTPDEAKTICQADYEQRIRSAITATVGTAEPGYVAGFEDGLRAAADWHKRRATLERKVGLESSAKAEDYAANAIAALPAPATASAGDEVTAEEIGLALRVALPNELPPAFFHRGSGVRETVANDIARRLKVEFAITKRS